MNRERLPNRRRSENFDFVHQDPSGRVFLYTATVGFYDDGRPGEVFLGAAKVGSAEDIQIKDSAIALSLALQYGCPLEVIAPTFLRTGAGHPEGPLGTLVGILAAGEGLAE